MTTRRTSFWHTCGIAITLLMGVVSVPGCLGYRFGNAGLYRNDIRTIHVPIVRSDSFRPELGVLITEALQKEIEKRTPYKLSQSATADSVLTVRLTNDAKRVKSEVITDEPRLLETVMNVELSWTDRRGMNLIETRFMPPGEVSHYFSERTDFVPEAGQSIATSFQRAAERLADHIVDHMEARW